MSSTRPPTEPDLPAPAERDAPPDAELRTLLASVSTIAVLGASTDPAKPAHQVPTYLQQHGYTIVPVNPAAAGAELFGATVAARLDELRVPVDVVDVFRRPEALPGHLDDILAMRPLPRVVWLQRGIRHDDVAAKLRAAGIQVTQDRCLKIEHRRLSAGKEG
jgi:predicted CoA-binding protein